MHRNSLFKHFSITLLPEIYLSLSYWWQSNSTARWNYNQLPCFMVTGKKKKSYCRHTRCSNSDKIFVSSGKLVLVQVPSGSAWEIPLLQSVKYRKAALLIHGQEELGGQQTGSQRNSFLQLLRWWIHHLALIILGKFKSAHNKWDHMVFPCPVNVLN